MAPDRRRRTPAPPATPAPTAAASDPALAELGLAEGDPVRFRRREGERWKPGTVARREADGSLGVRDPNGALRALRLELVEVPTVGPRGGVVWEPLTARVGRPAQMKLL